MASPQKENGGTIIANELYDVILKIPLTLRELKVLLTVIRFSYGFNRKHAELSLRFISKATHIRFHHISNSIKSLQEKNIITLLESSKHKQGRKIKLNKDYETWNFDSSPKGNSSQEGNGLVPKKVTDSSQKGNKEIQVKYNLNKGDELFETLIPLKLRGNGFLKIWEEWITYRKEIKKPIKSTTAKKQLKLLSEVADPKAVIEKSILNGWQGLFPDETHTTKATQYKEPERIHTNLN